MLVLSRKLNESVLIGSEITVKVIRIAGGKVRLGIDAPRGMNIVRDGVRVTRPADRDDDDDSETGNPVGEMQLEELPY